MLLDHIPIEGIFKAVNEASTSKVVEESFELYDQGLALSRACTIGNDLPQSVFQFVAFLADKVSPKELYLIIVEKLAWVQQLGPGDEGISEGALVYLLYSLQLCYIGKGCGGAKGQLHGNSVAEGLGMLLSTVASILESQQSAGGERQHSSFDILDVTLGFCRGLAMQSVDGLDTTSSCKVSSWREDDSLSIAAFVLNIVAIS